MNNVVLVAFIALAVVALLIALLTRRSPAAFWFKLSASLGFVVLGVVNSRGDDRFDRWVVLGLVFAAAGDVALALPQRRAFLIGVAAFAVGHLAYLAAAVVHARVDDMPAYALAVWVPSTAAYRWLHPRLGEMRGAVGAYVVIITVMVMGALALCHLQPERGQLFALGAVLFYGSDLSVARDRFVQEGFVNKAWGLPAYYAGQICIALSTAAL